MATTKEPVFKVLLTVFLLCNAAQGQHYCWPCAENVPVIGKDTHASQTPEQCYEFFFKYLSGRKNASTGYRTGYAPSMKQNVVESDDLPPNVLALEVNECGTTIGNFGQNISSGDCTPRCACCATHTVYAVRFIK